MSYRLKAPRVRQRASISGDSPERPAKRMKVEPSKAASPLLNTEVWDASTISQRHGHSAILSVSPDPWPLSGAQESPSEQPEINNRSNATATVLTGHDITSLLDEPNGWPAPWAGTLPSPFKGAVSPFADCRPGTGKSCFGMFQLRRFLLPPEGRLNGYVKVNRKRSRTRPSPVTTSLNPKAPVSADNSAYKSQAQVAASQNSAIVSSSSVVHVDSFSHLPDWTEELATNFSPEVLLGAFNSVPYSMEQPTSAYDKAIATVDPRWLRSSPNYDLNSFSELQLQLSPPRQLSPFPRAADEPDPMGSKLLDFYIHNFLPGRSILQKTNLWVDFARLTDVPSVMSAIQCYMGLYVFDYTQSVVLFRRINREFRTSELLFSKLLAKDARSYKEDTEFMVLVVMLAMQDIILFERRRKLPQKPRWLEAFLLAEKVIELRVPNLSFRKAQNVQLTGLQNAHSVMVGRSLILAQTMDKLHLESFDVTKEGQRFQWLWFGNLDEIHGGCGFSKKLLHTIGRVTWITAAVSQNPAFVVVGEHCLRMLQNLVQVNSESDYLLAPEGGQPVEALRGIRDGYIIQRPEEMTAVTAEAWRLAAIAYLQCRMMRLPRNHPDVVATVDDLAHCVRIMPTSGIIFTAQAPLLPVFFLGVLGTTSKHREICKYWMDMVMKIPVRSSVPPIASALKNLWEWTPQDSRLNPPTSDPVAAEVTSRDPWWEYLVEKVQNDEQEILCLT